MAGAGDHANRDEGARCLQIAEQALQSGDIARATRFAEKAMRLHPNDEVGRKGGVLVVELWALLIIRPSTISPHRSESSI